MNKSLRIAILTEYFWPEGGAPPGRLYELAVRLRRLGHEMTILTALPNYPRGRIYDEYRGRLWMTEHHEGLRILRAPIFPTQSARFFTRMTCYLSFAFSSVLVGLAGLGKQDILMVESPPLFLGGSAWLLAKTAHAHLVFNVSDVWPGSFIAMGIVEADSMMARMAFRVEKWLYEHSRIVTGTSPGLIRDIKQRYPHVPATVITNGVDTTWFRPDRHDPVLRRELGIPEGAFAFGYLGLPVVSTIGGELAEVLARQGAGESVPPEPPAMADEVEPVLCARDQAAVDHRRRRGSWVKAYDRPAIAAGLVRIIEEGRGPHAPDG